MLRQRELSRGTELFREWAWLAAEIRGRTPHVSLLLDTSHLTIDETVEEVFRLGPATGSPRQRWLGSAAGCKAVLGFSSDGPAAVGSLEPELIVERVGGPPRRGGRMSWRRWDPWTAVVEPDADPNAYMPVRIPVKPATDSG